MINANEIRIGNFFNHVGGWSYAKYDGIFQWSETDWYKLGEECLSLENIEPIPLNEEWLLKFGFENMDKYTNTIGQRINGKFGLMRCEWSEGECLISYHLFRTPNGDLTYFKHGDIPIIEHVHQLQNLFFALTGTELAIKE